MDEEPKENDNTELPIDDPKPILNINLQDKDIDFRSKRSKLECLLNNLKDKVSVEKINDNNNEFEKLIHNGEPVVSSEKIDQMKKPNRRKIRHKSTLNNNETKSIINKISKRRRRKRVVLNQKSKKKYKKEIKNIFSSMCSIKIKNPGQINKELEEDININSNGSKNVEINGQENNSIEAKDNLEISSNEEVHHLVDSQVNKDKIQEDKIKGENDVKDKDSILSDNTDISEISINDDLLHDLENINIPIGECSVPKEKEVESITIDDDNLNNDKTESCDNIIKEETSQTRTNNENSTECIVTEVDSKSNDNEDKNNIDSKISINENNIMATSSHTADTITENTDSNSTPINFYDDEQNFDPHEFDMLFENAILGLENTVLRPAKAKKRKAIAKLNTKVGVKKDINVGKDKDVDTSVINPTCSDKTEASSTTDVAVTKRKKINPTVKVENNIDIKTETSNNSDKEITNIDDVSLRGRKRRKKEHFDNKYDETKLQNDAKDISNDSDLELLKIQVNDKTVKRKKKVYKSLEYTKEEHARIEKEVQETIIKIKESCVESAVDVSKRGRIRHKNKKYNNDFNSNNKSKTIELKSKPKPKQIIIPQKKYYNKKKSTTSIKLINFENKAEESTNIAQDILNDLNTTFALNSDPSENSTNINIKKISTGDNSKSNNEIETTSNISPLSHSEENSLDDLSDNLKNENEVNGYKQTYLAIYKQYRGKRPLNNDDSISDSGVTFIDEVHTEADKAYKETDGSLENNDSKICYNLGPNYKELSSKEDKDDNSPEKQNEKIVLNTTSKKLVTVQSDTELFDTSTSDDIETITVFKISPKEMECDEDTNVKKL